MAFLYTDGAGGSQSDATGPSGKVIPYLWSAKYLVKWHKETVFDSLVNTDYEGEFQKYGDKITIRTIPNITITKFYKDQALVYERPTHAVVEMYIDQGQAWSFSLSDIDLQQSDIELANTWAEEALTQMHEKIEEELFVDWHDEAAAANKGKTAGAVSGDIDMGTDAEPRYITKDNVDDFLTDVTLVLDEQNVPDMDRSIVVPKWMGKLIKVSPMFADASKMNDGKSRLLTGLIGEVDGLTIYTSNSLETDTTNGVKSYHSFANHKKAISFATTIEENEVMRDQTTFRDLSRGLQVYGSKVTKPEGVVDCVIARG